MSMDGVIFDLDGVITDTAEYHYRAWQALADHHGLIFTRDLNERLRGVSREASLRMILDLNGKTIDEAQFRSMMTEKNRAYIAMLDAITPTDLMPGVGPLLDALDRAGIPYALGSASKNAAKVLTMLGIADRFAAIADGYSVPNPKPAPDLFRYAAAQMGCLPSRCLVVEDAAAGVTAAQRAGMAVIALGPLDRFSKILNRKSRTDHIESLAELTLDRCMAVVESDPLWEVVDTSLDPKEISHKETVFTIGNGYFASRGTFEEGFPGESAATFAHGIYDDTPVVFTTLVNLPDWLDMEIEVNGHRFRMDRGKVIHFSRTLDLARGTIQRDVRWEGPDGAIVDLTFERFISFNGDHTAAIRLMITPVNRDCEIKITSGINGHVSNRNQLHWTLDEQTTEAGSVWLKATTRTTGIQLGAIAQTSAGTACQDCPGHPRVIENKPVEKAQTLQFDKVIGFVSSRDVNPSSVSLRKRAQEAIQLSDYDSLYRAHIEAWSDVWADSDMVIEGDDEAQLAVRFNLFQLLVAAPKHDDRVSIGAKTLSGYGYSGHVFWDTEIFILPFFLFTQPKIARNMLMYRYHTLPGAERKAAGNQYDGAQYAWESAITGDEMTPTWVPHFSDRTKLVRIWTGDIQIHISADVAYALMQYWRVTGDTEFMTRYGAEMILKTAQFWASRAEPELIDGRTQYAFRDVIGPDEYHDHVDNNSYTNYMAKWHLQVALDLVGWLNEHAPADAARLFKALNLHESEFQKWVDVKENILFFYNSDSGLIDQFEGFFDLEEVSLDFIRQATQSLQVVFGIEGANERQVLKQADVIMLLCLFRDQFDQKTWQKNWDVYMPKTDHVYGSSLGPSFHAWAACEMNRPEEGYDHFMLAALADLRNPRGNAGDGIHAASAGGVWQAVAFGFAGLRLTNDGYECRPRLPKHWRRVAFTIKVNGKKHQIEVLGQQHN